jgi:predicted metal-dependent hydrolase
LSRWLVREAREYLVPRLQQLALHTGLRFRAVQVRRQRTRWGSCSRYGDISLNAKLLFLPPALADYVLLHELCHTVEMNHSKRFWAQVARYCADYRAQDAALREHWHCVPRWAR